MRDLPGCSLGMRGSSGKPWDGASNASEACHCGGAGAPCPGCKPLQRRASAGNAGGIRAVSGLAGMDELSDQYAEL
jgi:hypothetical protein